MKYDVNKDAKTNNFILSPTLNHIFFRLCSFIRYKVESVYKPK